MMKLTAFVTLMLVGMIYAARMSCDSCGQECERSCGSRRFRACCFNYFRKKRTDEVQFWAPNAEENQLQRQPAIFIEYIPEDPISRAVANNLKIEELTGSQMTN